MAIKKAIKPTKLKVETKELVKLAPVNRFEIQVKSKTAQVLKMIADLQIVDPNSYGNAVGLLADNTTLDKEIVEFWEPMKTPAHKAWKAICDKEKLMRDKTKEIDKALRAKIGGYLQAEEVKREAEERRLQEEAKKEQKKLLLQAKQADLKGQEEKAEILFERADAIDPTAIVAFSNVDQQLVVEGVGSVSLGGADYDFEITELDALLQAILTHRVTPDVIKIDLVKSVAKAIVKEKGVFALPGVTVKKKFGVKVSTPPVNVNVKNDYTRKGD